MSNSAPSVVDARPLAIGIVSAMRAMGSVIPPHAEKFLELSFTWLLNDAQALAFRFAASAVESRCGGAPRSDLVVAVFRDIGAASTSVADKAKAELAAMGKPS